MLSKRRRRWRAAEKSPTPENRTRISYSRADAPDAFYGRTTMMKPTGVLAADEMADKSWDSRDQAAPPAPSHPHPLSREHRKNWYDKLEAFVSGLSVRDTFWHRVCSLIW